MSKNTVHKMASFSVLEWSTQRIISDLAQYDDGTPANSCGCTVDSARTCLSRNAVAEILHGSRHCIGSCEEIMFKEKSNKVEVSRSDI